MTLGQNVFDCRREGVADEMRTSWEKLVQHIRTNCGQDISNELQNKATVTLVEPTHTAAVLTRHTAREQMIQTFQADSLTARRQQGLLLQQAIAADPQDIESPMKLAILQNKIAQAEFKAGEEIPIKLTDSEKTQHGNAWRTHHEWNAKLVQNRGQAFSLMQGQCTQLLQDRMKQDPDWTAVSTSHDPLRLHQLIEKTTLAQTEDQCPFATVCDQEIGLCGFRQENMTNPQWHERFDTKVDVTMAIGVTHQHKVLLEFVSQETHNAAFDTLTDAQKTAVKTDVEE